jgi:hypothetical protein
VIIRAPRPESNFYILSRDISEDGRLSWAARGLLIFLLGKPDHWRVSVPALINETRGAVKHTGRDGVYALLTELMNAGYVQRLQERGANGLHAEVRYVVSEAPLPDKTEADGQPLPAQPDTGQPDPVKADALVSTDPKQELKNQARTENPLFPQVPANETKPTKPGMPKPITLTDLENEGVESVVAVEFLALRCRKRAPLTPLALAGIRREAAKAALSLEDAMRMAIERGWQGFKAEWIRSSSSTTNEGCFMGGKKVNVMAYALKKVMENEGGLL